MAKSVTFLRFAEAKRTYCDKTEKPQIDIKIIIIE